MIVIRVMCPLLRVQHESETAKTKTTEGGGGGEDKKFKHRDKWFNIRFQTCTSNKAFYSLIPVMYTALAF